MFEDKSTIATHGRDGALSFDLIKVPGKTIACPSLDQLGLPCAHQPALVLVGASVKACTEPVRSLIRTYWCAEPPKPGA